jgi:acyl carrier protein
MDNDRQFDQTQLAAEVLGLVASFHAETHADASRPVTVKLDSQLERDLGFDSLARAELFSRIEQTLHVRVPLDAFATALTPADLARSIGRGPASAAPASSSQSVAQRVRAPTTLLADMPHEAETLITRQNFAGTERLSNSLDFEC